MKKLILAPFFTLFALASHAEECLKAPTAVCLVEKATDAAKLEPEGWGVTSLYEMLLAIDPDVKRREEWLAKYTDFANNTKIEGMKERLPAIRAEHLARLGKFEEAYKALGLIGTKLDINADPSLLIGDEARAGFIVEALARIDKMVEEESRDESRLEVFNLAIENKYAALADILPKFKDKFTKRLAQSALWGSKGEIKPFQKDLVEWVKNAKAENEFPFDTAENSKFESYDAYLIGALQAGNDIAFKEGLAARGEFKTSLESEYVARLLRPLIKTGRADLIQSLAPYVKLPAGEAVTADEDLNKLKKLSVDQLMANVKAADLIPQARAGMIDQTIEALILKGKFTESLRLFIDQGRVNDLNKATYDQDRVVPVFETVYRMAVAKNLPDLAELTSKITHEKAKDFMGKIAALRAKITLMENANIAEEPSEEDWSLIIDLVLHEGNNVKSANIATRIKDAGLRSSAFTQLIRNIWEKEGN
jgi:hypothetical protein